MGLLVPGDASEASRDGKVDSPWPPYHWLETPEIEPVVADFWKAKYDEYDLGMYNRFLEIMRLAKEGFNGEQIGCQLHMSNVRKYLKGEKMAFLTLLRRGQEMLGSPSSDHKWLPLRLKPRGTPGDA